MSTPLLYSTEAENAVLGALFLLANQHGPEVARDAALAMRERLPGEAFFGRGTRTIYEAIQGLVEARHPFDTVSLTQELRDVGMDDIGGEVNGVMYGATAPLLAMLSTFMPTASQMNEHAAIVHEKFLRRQVLRVCDETAAAMRDEQDGDVRAQLDHAQARMLAISERGSIEETLRLPRAGVSAAIAKLEDAYNNRGGISGIPSGLMDLDRMTTGWKKGQMWVIAGSTGMGKTALMLQFAAEMVFRHGLPVAFFSLEMSYEEIIERLVYAEGRVSLNRARDGHLSESDFKNFNAAATRVAEGLLYVDDYPGLNVFEYRARARRAVKKYGCRAIFGDYLQLFDGTEEGAKSGRDENRVQELQRISRGVKLVAKELGVPNFMGAQLNSKPDERKSSVAVDPYAKGEDDKPIRVMRYGVPQLSDLRECKAIAMDADGVLFPYRPWYFSKDEADLVNGCKFIEWAQIIVGKQRNGPVGPVPVRFVCDEARFETIRTEDGAVRENMFSNDPNQRQPVEEEG